MLIKKSSSEMKQNGESCTVWEYPFPSKNLWIAVVKIDGRYPEKGKAINKKCDIVYYIISWTGKIHNKDGSLDVSEWDSFFLEKNKWYWVEWNDLKMVLPSTPAWFFEQYEEVL